MSLFLRQLRYEQLVFWRSREAAMFVFLLPVLLFLLLGAVYDGEIEGHAAASWLLVGMIGYGLANTALGGLAIFLVLRREYGILKRLRATPLPAPTYLGAVVASTLIVFLVQVVALVALGILAYDAELPRAWGSFLLAAALGAVAFTCLGLAAAALIRSAEGASPIVNVVVLPMAFLSGSFGRTEDYPRVLQEIADVLPLRYLIRLVRESYLEGTALWTMPESIAVVAAWGAAGLVLAARRFGWSPRDR